MEWIWNWKSRTLICIWAEAETPKNFSKILLQKNSPNPKNKSTLSLGDLLINNDIHISFFDQLRKHCFIPNNANFLPWVLWPTCKLFCISIYDADCSNPGRARTDAVQAWILGVRCSQVWATGLSMKNSGQPDFT